MASVVRLELIEFQGFIRLRKDRSNSPFWVGSLAFA